MTTIPPDEVVEAVEAGVTEVTRRVEIFEYDGETEWLPANVDLETPRLIDGNISLASDRDERRMLEGLTLSNADDALRPNPYGFWYDKVIKAYRGVRYRKTYTPPKIAIIEALDLTRAYAFRTELTKIGLHRTTVVLNATTAGALDDFDIIVSNRENLKSQAPYPALMKQLYEDGKNIFTIGNDSTATEIPLILSTTSSGSVTWNFQPVAHDTPLSGGWTAETNSVGTGFLITSVQANTIVVAEMLVASTPYPAVLIGESSAGGRWFHYQGTEYKSQALALFKKAIAWMYDFQSVAEWELQVGEFVIDTIIETNFPYNVVVDGRDYTKRCMTSKLERSISFPAGTSIIALVQALAANAGITKFNLPSYAGVLGNSLELERGTPRWDVMKDAAISNGWNIFFDNLGRLSMEPFADPALDPVFMTYSTGRNLVEYSKRTHDSNLFNHVIVIGENESQDGGNVALPFFGEARNDDLSSPTNITAIGDRTMEYSSTYFTSDDQCANLASKFLKIYALESYEIDWTSLCYPWQDVNKIIELLMDRRHPLDPTRYLIDTLNIPLSLGPMTATGKRVTIIGSA